MMRTVGSICILLGLIAVFVSFLPWMSCTMGYPGNAASLTQQFPSLAVPLNPTSSFGEGAGICWSAYPISGERLPLGVGLLLLTLGVFGKFFGGARSDDELHVPEHIREQQRLTAAQRPIEAKHHNLTSDELERGIEIDVDLAELGLSAPENDKPRKRAPDEEETLMDQVVQTVKEIERREHEEEDARAHIDGFYCPPGMIEHPVLYVDPLHEGASDEDEEGRGASFEQPFKSIMAAIDRAKHRSRMEGCPIQVRLAPGVYQEALVIPKNVMVVNHRLPAEGDVATRMTWLMNLTDVSSQDRVTILAPEGVEAAVEFEPGSAQGLFGCHIVSREKTAQAGVMVKRGDGITVVNCIIDGFRRGGAVVDMCGSDLSMGGVQFLGCGFLNNKAHEGGALFTNQSAVNIEQCFFQGNQAKIGGAIFASSMRAPLQLSHCEFKENRAQTKSIPQIEPELIEPLDWEDLEGVGGGVWIADSHLKIVRCQFRDNGASVAGGALAMLSCKAIIAGTADEPIIVRGGRARTGGGIFASSHFAKGGTIRATHMNVEHCFGKYAGGGVALLGKVVMQLEDSRIEFNKADEVEGVGGGVGLFSGAELVGSKLIFRSNHAGEGAGIMARNASLRLKNHSIFQDNESHFAAGAGVLVDTIAQPHLEDAVAQQLMKLPFVIKLIDVEFVGNLSVEAPSALGIGDFAEDAVLSIGVELGKSVDFRSNRVHGQKESLDGDEFLIRWRDEPKMTERTIREGKFLLG